MELKRITSIHHPLYQEALEIYQRSFPYHEQREPFSQAQILRQEAYHFDVICDNGKFVGDILYWSIGAFLYVEHFCIHPAMRNKQYGQRALALLQKAPLILEIDPPKDEISLRRKAFYERCGFVENPYPHIHPPYHKDNSGHELVIMSCPKTLTECEYNAFNRYLQAVIMNQAY
ncbi:MAG: GNAT family N-acetyltransferase [Eubacteriales bacterium]|nr:GNAT family N-acetyltransferase [Eubacteriales bacterium]